MYESTKMTTLVELSLALAGSKPLVEKKIVVIVLNLQTFPRRDGRKIQGFDRDYVPTRSEERSTGLRSRQ